MTVYHSHGDDREQNETEGRKEFTCTVCVVCTCVFSCMRVRDRGR